MHVHMYVGAIHMYVNEYACTHTYIYPLLCWFVLVHFQFSCCSCSSRLPLFLPAALLGVAALGPKYKFNFMRVRERPYSLTHTHAYVCSVLRVLVARFFANDIERQAAFLTRTHTCTRTHYLSSVVRQTPKRKTITKIQTKLCND